MTEPTRPTLDEIPALADAAFRQAAAKVILRARQTGTPLIVRVGGEVRSISPDEYEEKMKEAADDAAGLSSEGRPPAGMPPS